MGLVAAASAVLDLIPSNFDSVVVKSNKPAFVELFVLVACSEIDALISG